MEQYGRSSFIIREVSQAAQKRASFAEERGHQIRALLAYLNLGSEDWTRLCQAQAREPRDWKTWMKGDATGHGHARESSPDGGWKRPRKKRSGIERGFRAVAASHVGWKKWLDEKRLQSCSLQLHQLDAPLHKVWEAYCDPVHVVNTGVNAMTVGGLLRLLMDCCLLDNITTPAVVDCLCHGSLTPPPPGSKELLLDYQAFRDCLARVAAQRHAVKEALKVPAWKQPGPADVHSAAFLEPMLHLSLPAHFPIPVAKSAARSLATHASYRGPRRIPSSLSLKMRASNAAANPGNTRTPRTTLEPRLSGSSILRKSDAQPKTHRTPRASLSFVLANATAAADAQSRPSSVASSCTSRGRPASISSRIRFGDEDGASLILKPTFSGAYHHRGHSAVSTSGYTGIRTEDTTATENMPALHSQWMALVRDWVLPLASASPHATSTHLDWLFTRNCLDMLRSLEPGLRSLFSWYAFLGQPSHLPWLRLVQLKARVDARHMVELLYNFTVAPFFVSRAAACTCYAACPPSKGRQGLFDGGLNFSRFLVTLAILGTYVADTLQPRLQVHLTPEELRDVRRYISVVTPPVRHHALEQTLDSVQRARRAGLDDEGQTASGLSFFDYQGKRLEWVRFCQQHSDYMTQCLKVLDRREELRQHLALTRLHNYYSDVRGSVPTSTQGTHGHSTTMCHPKTLEELQDAPAHDQPQNGQIHGSKKGIAFFSDQVPIKTPKIKIVSAPSQQLHQHRQQGSHTGQLFQSPRGPGYASETGEQGQPFPALPASQPHERSSRTGLTSPHECPSSSGPMRKLVDPSLSSKALNHQLRLLTQHGLQSSGPSCGVQVVQIEAKDECDYLHDFTLKLPNIRAGTVQDRHQHTCRPTLPNTDISTTSEPPCTAQPCADPYSEVPAVEPTQPQTDDSPGTTLACTEAYASAQEQTPQHQRASSDLMLPGAPPQPSCFSDYSLSPPPSQLAPRSPVSPQQPTHSPEAVGTQPRAIPKPPQSLPILERKVPLADICSVLGFKKHDLIQALTLSKERSQVSKDESSTLYSLANSEAGARRGRRPAPGRLEKDCMQQRSDVRALEAFEHDSAGYMYDI